MIVNSSYLDIDPSQWRTWNRVSALDADTRVIRNPGLFSDISNSETSYLDSPDLNVHLEQALERLQKWHEAQSTLTRRTRRKPKRRQMSETETVVCKAVNRTPGSVSRSRATTIDDTKSTAATLMGTRTTGKANKTIHETPPVCLRRCLKPVQRRTTKIAVDDLAIRLAERWRNRKPKQEPRKQHKLAEVVACQHLWQDDSCSYHHLNLHGPCREYLQEVRSYVQEPLKSNKRAGKNRGKRTNPKSVPQQSPKEDGSTNMNATAKARGTTNIDEDIEYDFQQMCTRGKVNRQVYACGMAASRSTKPPRFCQAPGSATNTCLITGSAQQ